MRIQDNNHRYQELEVLKYLLNRDIEPRLINSLLASGFGSTFVGGLSTMFTELEKVPLIDNETLTSHLNQIKERGLRRELAQLTQRINFLDDQESIATLVEEHQKIFEELVSSNISEPQILNEELVDLLPHLLELTENVIPTFSPWLNNTLGGGLGIGELSIIVAPPATGKTTFSLFLGLKVAELGIPVLYLSYEMTKVELVRLALSYYSQVDSRVLRRKEWLIKQEEDLEVGERERRHKLFTSIESAIQELTEKAGKNLEIIYATPHIHTPKTIKPLIQNLRKSLGVDRTSPVLVIADHMHIMNSGYKNLDSSGGSLNEKLSAIANDLKRIAEECHCHVWALAATTKESLRKYEGSGTMDADSIRDSLNTLHAANIAGAFLANTLSSDDKEKTQLDLFLDENYMQATEKSKIHSHVTKNYPLNPQTDDCYARLKLLKNRAGTLNQPLFVFRKSTATFIPINLPIQKEEFKADF